MNTANRFRVSCHRPTDSGAVLVVVLIVTIALLGLGMTGLFLTSGSMQMNTNINLRNQALVVAEAGIERARAVLNSPNAVPSIPALLVGATPSWDEVPGDTTQCLGEARGAIVVDKITTDCSGTPTPPNCTLRDVAYPSLDRVSDLPPSAGTVARATMGKYTVYIRQDLADCRMGNFVCDEAPVSTVPDGGVAVGGPLTCTPPVGVPEPNRAVVVRSEGVASDDRTRVVLEVTMTPSVGTQQGYNTPMAALDHPNDPPGFGNGIVVNSTAPQQPPAGMGGAPGAGGAPGTGGSSAPGSGAGGTAGGTGGSASGGVPGAGGSGMGGSGTGGSSCGPCSPLLLATIGLTGIETSVNFKKWLDKHASSCARQDLQWPAFDLTPERLAPYKVLIVLDVDHTQAHYDAFLRDRSRDLWSAVLAFCKPSNPIRAFKANEVAAVKNWVQGGGGLFMTQGYNDSLWIIGNSNALIQPMGLTFYSPDCGLDKNNCFETIAWQDIYGQLTISGFRSHDVTKNMTKLFASGLWPVSSYPPAPSASPPSWLPAPRPTSTTSFTSGGGSYEVLATQTYTNHKNATVTHNALVVGSYGSGRIVVFGDEWITSDTSLTDGTYGPSATALWDNSVKWLGQCTTP